MLGARKAYKVYIEHVSHLNMEYKIQKSIFILGVFQNPSEIAKQYQNVQNTGRKP